jgi:hypothetical protein
MRWLLLLVVFSFGGLQQLSENIYETIEHRTDAEVWGEDHWQSPSETLTMGTGDCEDVVVLMAYIIHRDLGALPYAVGGTNHTLNGMNHLWLMFKGQAYDPLYLHLDYTDPGDYEYVRRITFDELMRRAGL